MKTIDEAFKFCSIVRDAHMHTHAHPSLQVVNCTGLGSRTLFNDQLVYPMRGQILRIRHNGFKAAVYARTHTPAIATLAR